MHLYLVRHGAVSPSRPGVYYGGTEVPLSAQGEAEARAAASWLSSRNVDQVVCSPLGRAQFGAERVAEACGAPKPRIVDGFREIDRGRWLDFLPEEIRAKWPDDLDAHAADPESWNAHGGESLGTLRDRVLQSRDDVLATAPGEALVIVSHMWPTKAMVADALGLGLQRWSELRIPTGSISHLEHRGSDGWVVHGIGLSGAPERS